MLEKFARLVAAEVNLSATDLESEEMGEILAHYFEMWSKSENPMFIDMCVEAIYAAL